MKRQTRRAIPLILVVALSILVSTAAGGQAGADPNDSQSTPSYTAPSPWFTYPVIVVVLAMAFFSLALIRGGLADSTWSLAEALSEEVEVTDMETDASGTTTPREKDGKTVMVTKMCASSSRLIAFMGMIIIMLMFLGFGAFALYTFATTNDLPKSIDRVVRFLLAGLTLFAPYVANKFATTFESLGPKKRA